MEREKKRLDNFGNCVPETIARFRHLRVCAIEQT
jgi:hypothetical protein